MSQEERNKNFQDMQNLRKKQEICDVHIPRSSERKNCQNNSDVKFQEKQRKLNYSQSTPQNSVPTNKKFKDFRKQVQEIIENEGTDKMKCQDTANEIRILREMEEKQEKNPNSITGMDLNISKPLGYSLHNKGKDTEERISVQNSDSIVITALMKANDSMHHPDRSKTEKHCSNETESSSSFPEILHKTILSKSKIISFKNNDKQFESSNEKFPNAILPQSHSLNSDLSSNDTEAALKGLTNLQSLRANQSIYKLAYDESITDQSEADSRSPSPINPETQVPRSIINDEILIHEADSCSDAGSEDVELIPHRYESETFLNENKHMYVNKLSLAVELLRTQESLPYDEQFKRVLGEGNLKLNPDTTGEMNFGFLADSSSFNSFEERTGNQIPFLSHNVITSQSQTNSRISNFLLEDACTDSHDEVVSEAVNTQDNSEGVRAGYRRFQVQFRHYFAPRVNPCLCCVVM